MSRSVTSSSGNEFRTVSSSVGFSAGDYVYLTANGYSRVPDGVSPALNFPNNNPALSYKASTTQNMAGLSFDVQVGGANYGENVAKLTNGNIVIVYFRPTNPNDTTSPVYFKIVDTAGATVVAETQVNPTNAGASGFSATVTETGNGGFAVAWTGATNTIYARVYNSSAVATSSEVSIGTFTTSYRKFSMAGRSDGSFVIIYANASTQPSYAVISSTGTSLYTGTWGGTSLQSAMSWGDVTVRSDDSFQLFSINGAGISYSLRSATNGSLASGTLGTASFDGRALTCFVMGSDEIYVLCQTLFGGSIQGFVAHKIVGTTATSLTVPTHRWSTNPNGVFVGKRIDGTNNFAVIGVRSGDDPRGVAYGFRGMICEIYDSSFNRLNTNLIWINPHISSTAVSGTSLMTVGGNLRIYRTMLSTVVTPSTAITYTNISGVAYATLNPTTYAFVGAQTEVINVGNTSASFPVGNYSRAGSTPTGAAFIATVSGVGTSTSASNSTIVPQTIIESTVIQTMDAKSLPSGGFAVLYQTGNGGGAIDGATIKIAIYNVSGVLQTNFTVATCLDRPYASSMAVLANGKIVVTYYTDNNVLRYKIFSTSYVELASAIISSAAKSINPSGGNPQSVAAVCAVGNYSYWALAWSNDAAPGGLSPYVNVYDDAGTSIYTNQIEVGGDPRGFCINGNISGEIFVNFSNSGVERYANLRRGTSPSNYATTVATLSSSGFGAYGFRISAPASNLNFGFFFQGFNDPAISVSQSAYDGAANYLGLGEGINDGWATWGIGYTSNGNLICLGSRSGGAASSPLRIIQAGVGLGSPNSSTISLGMSVASGSLASPAVVPLPGNRFAAVMRDSSNYPTYAIFTAITYEYPIQIVSGSTVSAPLFATTLATRYSLVGVAVTDCAPGGSGIVQTKGNATLGSSYTSTINEPFFFQNYYTEGKNGITNGRSVILQGN